MTQRTIYLIRHGQYDLEVKEEPLGGGLTEVGITQAERTAEALASVPFTAIHSSNLHRAVETANIIARRHPHLSVVQSELLQEITPPLPYLAMKYIKEISAEQITKDRKQIELAYSLFFTAPGDAHEVDAIICHGNVIRYFVCRALQISPLVWMNFEIYNCSISMVEIDAHGNTILLSYNESGHLSDELKTQNLSPMGMGLKYLNPEPETVSSEEAT